MLQRKMTMEDHRCTDHIVRQSLFIGRKIETQNLKEILMDAVLSKKPVTRVILITGEPMIGKTRFSKEVCHRLVTYCHHSHYRLDTYFIELRKVTSFSTVIVRLSAAFGMPPCSSEYDIIKHFRERKHNCLLIFDGAEHLSVDISADLQTQFLDFCARLVNNSKVMMIITSRFQYRMLSIRAKVYHHRLKPLSIDESVELLKTIAVKVDFLDKLDKSIAKLCAGIPLALEIAAAMLQDNSYTARELFDLLENNCLDTLSDESYSQGEQVRPVIKSSVDKLRDILKTEYIKLSYFPSSFNANAVAYVLEFSNGKSALAKQNVLIPLATRSLVAMDTFDRFDIHDFLREYLSDELASLPMEQLLSLRNRYCVFYGKLLQALAPVVEEDSCKKLPLFTIEIINIQKLLHEAALCPSEDYDLFLDIACKAEYLIINFLPRRESVEFYAACVRAAESRNKRKHLGLMLSSYGQALNFTASDWKVAQEQYERAADCLAPYGDTVDKAWLLNHIGWNLHMQGFWKDALKYFADAEETLMRMSGAERREDNRWKRILASVWSCLGISYVVLDVPERGIEYHEKVLKMRRKLWGDHPSIGGTFNNMSLAYIRMGNRDKALLYSQKGLDTKMRFNREPANDIIVSLNNVAINTCIYKSDPVKAHKLLDKSFEMRESLGLRHVDTALIAHNRGRVYEYQNNYREAIRCYEKAVNIRENLQGQHRSTARAMYNLASLKIKLNELDDALKLFNKCYNIRRNVLTGSHRNTELGEVMEGLGTLHEKRNELFDADTYFNAALEEFDRLRKLFEEQGNSRQVKQMMKCTERIRRNIQTIRKKMSMIETIDYTRIDKDENDDDSPGDNDINMLMESFSHRCTTSSNEGNKGNQQEGFTTSTVKNGQAQDATKIMVVNDVDHQSDAHTTFADSIVAESLTQITNDTNLQEERILTAGQDTLVLIPGSPESAYCSGSCVTNLFQSSVKKENMLDTKGDTDGLTGSGFNEHLVDRIITEEIKPFLKLMLGKEKSLKKLNLKVQFEEAQETQDMGSRCKLSEEILTVNINENAELVLTSEVQIPVNSVNTLTIQEDCAVQVRLPENRETLRCVQAKSLPDDCHNVANKPAEENVRKIILNKCGNNRIQAKTETTIGNCDHASVENGQQASGNKYRKPETRHSTRVPRGRIMYREEFERIKKKSIQTLDVMEILNYHHDQLDLHQDKLAFTCGKYDSFNKCTFNESVKRLNKIEKEHIIPNKMPEKTTSKSFQKESLPQTCGTDFTKCSGSRGNSVVSFDAFKTFPRNSPAYFFDDNLLLSEKQQQGSQVVVDILLDHCLPNESNNRPFNLQSKQ